MYGKNKNFSMKRVEHLGTTKKKSPERKTPQSTLLTEVKTKHCIQPFIIVTAHPTEIPPSPSGLAKKQH